MFLQLSSINSLIYLLYPGLSQFVRICYVILQYFSKIAMQRFFPVFPQQILIRRTPIETLVKFHAVVLFLQL